MKITFLGTNGWYATATGNTVCAVIETSFNYIVLDAGDGLYRLDSAAFKKSKPVDIFLSHFHLDHVIGLHVLPRFCFRKKIRIFGQPGTKNILKQFVRHPYTAPLSKIAAGVTVHDLCKGMNLFDSGYRVMALPLCHVDPCFGFRFELDGKIVAYCADTGPCANMERLAKNADLLVSECAFLPGSRLSKSWPHLNPESAARVAKKASCRKLILTHFDAYRYDTLKKRAGAQKIARKIFPRTFVARDMLCVRI